MLNIFNSGSLFIIPEGSTPTPVRVAALQEIRLSFDIDMREVQTQLGFPVKFTQGLSGITATAKTAKIDGAGFSRLAYGAAAATGSRLVTLDAENVIPVGADPTVTITPPSSGVFAFDMGVIDDATGLPLTRTATVPVPATGQYAVVGAAYHFYTAQTGETMRISYAYDSTSGKKLTLTNQYRGIAPKMAAMLTTSFPSCKQVNFWLPAVVVPQFVVPQRLEQYAIPEFTFKVQDDGSGNIGIFSFAE